MTSTRNTVAIPEETGYFVWRKTAKGGVAPEKWFQDFIHCHNGKYKNSEVQPFADARAGELVGFHKVPMSILTFKTLEELEQLYPAPK